jgi:hypothetical protein
MNVWIDLNGNEVARIHPGRISHLQAVPEEDILTFPDEDPETQIVEDDIVLKNGKSWKIVKLISAGRAFQEQSSRTPAGTIIEQLVAGILLGQSEYNHLQVNNWLQRRWVLLLREVGTEITYIIGSPDRGCRFDFNYDNSSSTITGVSFTRQADSRARIYQGTLGTAATGSGGSGSGGSSTVKSTKEFLVGDAPPAMQDGETEYSHADLIDKQISVYVDGVRVRSAVDGNRLWYSFSEANGTITFSTALAEGTLVTIDYE